VNSNSDAGNGWQRASERNNEMSKFKIAYRNDICIYIYATAYLQYSVRQVRLLYLAQFHVANGSGYAIQNTENLIGFAVIKNI